jgi:hypothetical protein
MLNTKAKQAFLIGLAFGLVGAAAGTAKAWNRTVPANGNLAPLGGPGQTIPFPSDGTSGTPNGNSATYVYVDFSIVGLPAGQTATVRMIACGQAYNGASMLCGTPYSPTYTANGNYDVALSQSSRWGGTGSVWDYFTVLITNMSGSGTVYPTGIGVQGT